MEGASMLPAFEGRELPPRTLVYQHDRNIAIRVGDYKLVAHNAVGPKALKPDAQWALYHIPTDPTEQRDLAASQPERITEMLTQLEAEANRTMVVPAR